jgi:hypothetical protein
MIRDWEVEFLDARNLKKLEQMRKDALTKWKDDLILLEATTEIK